MDVHNFYIKDCPTEEMNGDFHTKPLRGKNSAYSVTQSLDVELPWPAREILSSNTYKSEQRENNNANHKIIIKMNEGCTFIVVSYITDQEEEGHDIQDCGMTIQLLLVHPR